MGLKEFYHSIEDAYYGLMDKLDRAGIPVYKVIDAIESKNIPSFPFFVLFLVVILCLLYYFIAIPMIGPTTNSFSLVVASDKGPIENAAVKLKIDDVVTTHATDEKGKIVLSIPKGKAFQVTVMKEGFEEKTQSFNANETSATITLTAETKTITVRLLKAGTNELIDQDISVSFLCSENQEYYDTKTSNEGIIELEDVPSDCGAITADSRELDCEDCTFNSSESSPSIYLQEEEEGKGRITVSVQDEKFDPIAGIIARVIPNNGSTTEEASCTTNASGSCTAGNVPFGEYYFTLTDSSEKYEFYDSSAEDNFITVNSYNTNPSVSTVTLKEKIAGQIKVKIIDAATREAVEGAEVKLFKDGKELYTKNSGEDGIAVFNVSENVPYSLTVNHVDYLIPGPLSGIKPSDETREIEMTRADSTNSQRIEVQVLDEKEEPVENAKLFLKDADRPSVIIGQMLVTGMDGRAQFERVKEGRYIVYAEKIGSEGKNSDIVTVKARQPASVIIHLTIGQGTIELKLLNEEQQGIQGATIKVMDYFTDKEIAAELTDTKGEKSLTIRADKKVYLIASESSKADYTTTPMQLFQGTQTKTITMIDLGNAKNFKVILNGIYGANEEEVSEGQGETATVLDSGQSFKVKMQLILPNASYSSAGIHLRTGADTENQNNAMEQDDLYLKEVTASNARIIKGTSFNPSNGYAIDSQHLTSGNSKWANVIFSNPKAGVIEVEGIIQLRGNPSSAQMNLAYRGWAVAGGTYLRDPYDSELKEAEGSATKQSLYAKAKYEPIRAGTASLCTEKFCYWFRITDQTTGIQTTVSDSMPAEISNSYLLEFNLISLSEQKFSEVSLNIANDGQGIEFKNFNIAGENKNVKTSKILKPLGEISRGEKISGTIEFTTKKEGVNKIDLSLSAKTSLGTEKIFFKSIKMEVQAAQEFELQVVPLVLVSLIQNNIIVKAVDSDGNPLGDVTIKVRKNNNNLFSGTTNEEGIYSFSLEPIDTGTKISIIGEKRGFMAAEKEMTATEQVLLFSPPSISESFNAAKDVTIKRDLIIRNTTEVPLSVRAIEFSDDFRKLISLNLSDGIIGEELTSVVDYNALLSIKMTAAGRNIEELTEMDGKIIITLESSQLGRQWIQEIPLSITIGLGNEVDQPDCLSISPNEWSISLEGGKTKTKIFNLANNCKVEGKPLELKKLKARIAWENGNETGTFTITKFEGAGRIQLGTSWKDVSPIFKPTKDNGAEIEIQFKADDISSGTGEPKIEFRTENRTIQGLEELETQVKTKVNVSKLSECLQVIQRGQLTIELGPYNYGYGMYPQQFGYNPYQQAPYYYQQFNQFYPDTSYGGYGNNPNVVMYPEQLNQSYPYSYFSEPLTNSFNYSNQYNYSFMPPPSGRSSFTIQNNCSDTVQVDIEPDQALGVSKNTLTLEPGKNEEIKVNSTMYAGNYGIYIRAKLKDSTESKVDITRLSVLVESEYLRNYRDCIFLNKRTFQFNDFIAKPDTGIIFNKCYDIGVRLNYDSIGMSWGYSTKKETTSSPISVTKGILKDDGIRVIELLEKPGPENKIIQQLEFEMIKDTEKSYRNEVVEELKKIEASNIITPVTQIGFYRAKITAGYYEVEAPANLSVKFTNRTGMSQSLSFDIIIEDKWAALPFISEEINWGDPNVTKFQNCIDLDALNVTNYWAANGNDGCLEENQFTNNVYEFKSDKKVMKIGKGEGMCGSVDTLSQLSPQVYTDSASGLKLIFQIVDGHDVKLRVDKSKLTKADTGVIKMNVYAKLTRLKPSGTQDVYIPINVCVKLKEKPIELTPDEKACKEKIEKPEQLTFEELEKKIKELCASLSAEGKQKVEDALKALFFTAEKCDADSTTGQGASLKYGFDKLKFTWNPANIDNQFCYNSFCDATQNSIASVKKFSEIKDFVSGKESELKLTCKDEIINGIANTICTKKDSQNLYRFAASQARVKDSITQNGFVFFTGDNGIIEGSKIEATGDIKTYKENVLKWISVKDVVASTELLLNALKDSKKDSIVMEINYNDATKKYYSSHFAPLGIEDLEGFTEKKYVMTLNEFKAFHEKLKKSLAAVCPVQNNTPIKKDCCTSSSNCYISSLIDQTKQIEITTQFIKDLYNNLSFKVGIRNTADLSKEEIQIILKKGKLEVTTSEINLIEKFEKLYNENIDSNVLLVKDTYTADFKEDFCTAYPPIGAQNLDEFNKEWSFKNESVEAGKYGQILNYNWETKKVELKFTQLENLEKMDERNQNKTEYHNNYFFSLPFDGTVGFSSGTYSREGYGIGYGSLKNSIYINKEENLDEYTIIGKETTGSSNGLMKFNADLRQKFEQARNGTVLSVDGSAGKFEFTPSTPLIVSAELTASTTEKRGMSYGLEMNSKELGIADETNLTSIFNWTSCSGATKNDSKIKMNALESNAGTVEHFGLIESSGNTITYASLSFLPSNSTYFMAYQLFKNVKSFNVFHSYNESTGKFTKSVLDASNKRVGQNTAINLAEESIKKWINRIEGSHVCVKPLSQGIELSWNKAKLIEEAKAQYEYCPK